MAYKFSIRNTIYKREWMAQRRANFLADKKCKECGATKELRIIWPIVNGKRTKMRWSYNLVRLEPVLNQTEIYCKNHFREEKVIAATKPVIHATVRGYKNGCRCRPCKNASNEYEKIRRKNNAVKKDIFLEETLKRQGIPRHIFDRLKNI